MNIPFNSIPTFYDDREELPADPSLHEIEEYYALSLLYKGELKIFPDLEAVKHWSAAKDIEFKSLEIMGHYRNAPLSRKV